VGGATNKEADELLQFVDELEKVVRGWLKAKHANLLTRE